MNMTIAVRPKEQTTDFTFADLELFHQDCGGGVLTKYEKNDGWRLTCKRCGIRLAVLTDHGGATSLSGTAVDGKTREFNAFESVITVVQKR